jgi:hypothetical protein
MLARGTATRVRNLINRFGGEGLFRRDGLCRSIVINTRREVATLVYKLTHPGDPHPRGWWGVADCMGKVREFKFDAVIGIGGAGKEPQRWGIARKLLWIGIGPDRVPSPIREDWSDLVTFEHFLAYGNAGPLLAMEAPVLAKLMYGQGCPQRYKIKGFTKRELNDIDNLLERAKNAPRSDKPPRVQPIRSDATCGCH